MRVEKSEVRVEGAKRLRAIRQSREMSQERFAEMLNISVSAYKKIESGENNISIANLHILHETLGISADYLLFGDSSDFDQIWTQISRSPETVKLKLLLRMLHYFGDAQDDAYDKAKRGDIERIITRLIDSIEFDG